MSKIFINYRQDDTSWSAQALYQELITHFPENIIFKDFNTIAPGEDFVESISHALEDCNVLLILIGKQWLTIQDKNGARRIDNPHDYVRLEIATALKRNVRVIPVLFDDTPMPESYELPEDLKKITTRQYVEIDKKRFESDTEKLVKAIQAILDAGKARNFGDGARQVEGKSGGEVEKKIYAERRRQAEPGKGEKQEQKANANGAPNTPKKSKVPTAIIVGFVILIIIVWLANIGDTVDETTGVDTVTTEALIDTTSYANESEDVPTETTPTGLQIKRARYGTSKSSIDVSLQLRQKIRNNKLWIVASNYIAGDPDPGNVKTLSIMYRNNGEDVVEEFIEGDTIRIPSNYQPSSFRLTNQSAGHMEQVKIERVQANFFRLKYVPNNCYLHMEYEDLSCDAANTVNSDQNMLINGADSWSSAFWIFERQASGDYFIRNAWRAEQGLIIEDGAIVCRPIQEGTTFLWSIDIM